MKLVCNVYLHCISHGPHRYGFIGKQHSRSNMSNTKTYYYYRNHIGHRQALFISVPYIMQQQRKASRHDTVVLALPPPPSRKKQKISSSMLFPFLIHTCTRFRPPPPPVRFRTTPSTHNKQAQNWQPAHLETRRESREARRR